ncbi:hypothetical protein GCM10022255_110700 [Dactylosporangium darangshiense]|uniref:Uncharacterized protein n=1 Tax=Dactylosporangium darangshiense TaxID=579108 RepID=A0ABP8DUJ2_9ACTN
MVKSGSTRHAFTKNETTKYARCARRVRSDSPASARRCWAYSLIRDMVRNLAAASSIASGIPSSARHMRAMVANV